MKNSSYILINSVIIFVFILSPLVNPVVGNPLPVDDKYQGSPFPNEINTTIFLKNEFINVTFNKRTAMIDASYSFQNEANISANLSILLPLASVYIVQPTDIDLLSEESVLNYTWINYTIDLEALGFEPIYDKKFRSIIFNLSFDPYEIKSINITYSRSYIRYNSIYESRIYYNYMYLAGTARVWNHTIDSALFKFWIPKTLCNWDPPIIPGDSEIKENRDYYIVEKRFANWIPNRYEDFIRISWEEVKPITQTFWGQVYTILTVAILILGSFGLLIFLRMRRNKPVTLAKHGK
jgi:hypothetical protein